MANVCAAPGPDDPLVRGLLDVVDCNTQELVHAGYSALFQPSSIFSGLLTALLVIYVGVIGYRLMLGQSQLRVSDFAVTAVKIGAVIALATQWDTYQAVVYRFLFDGPAQLAGAMVKSIQPQDSAFRGDVFDGLQRAFDDLSGFANGYAAHAPAQVSPLLGGAGFGALLLNSSASILLLSSLGVLLASKIVLGLLLAVGPLFIALFLFDSTRGLSEGWLRAAIAFGFAPLATILMLGVALTMLEPSLLQMEEMRKNSVFTLGPVYSVATLVLVFAGVSLGAIIAGGMIAMGLRLPRSTAGQVASDKATEARETVIPILFQSRAARVAAAAAGMERRDTQLLASAPQQAFGDRRVLVAVSPERRAAVAPPEPRLGQSQRRVARPRTPRPTARSA